MSAVRARLGGLKRSLRGSKEPQPLPELITLSDEERHWLVTPFDDSTPLPEGADDYLRPDNPYLADLRARYTSLDVPATAASRWTSEAVESFLDLRYFRGETLITWHYRELKRITELKYFAFMRYVRDRDAQGMLERLGEDGAFGCWSYEYPSYGRFSRDLIESVNEIHFLERALSLSSKGPFGVLDIGAGYGRLAHRLCQAFPDLTNYVCVDAVPESTFICDYYLGARGLADRARSVPLDEVGRQLRPGAFELALNVHSFSECPLAAIDWWMTEVVARLGVPWLLIVPNEPDELLSLEADGTRRDFRPSIERAGYRLARSERIVGDPAVRELIPLEDTFFLFELEAGRAA